MSFPLVPEVSRNSINQAGIKLSQRKLGVHVRSEEEEAEAIELVNAWRIAHQYPLNTFNVNLRDKVKDLKSAIVAQRLKRMPTILDKLNREPSMQVTTMQDIAGVRAVVKTVKSVYRVVDRYKKPVKKTHELIGEHDYIASPRGADGYRSVHLIFKYVGANQNAQKYDGLKVEVQIRTKLQHIWATAVETAGVMLGQQLKSRKGEQDWLEFFASVSNVLALNEGTAPVPGYEGLSKKDAYLLVREKALKLNVINKLEGFSKAMTYIEKRGSKVGRPKNGYFLLMLDTANQSIRIAAYARHEADRAGKDLELMEKVSLEKPENDAVLVSVGPLDDLKKAYPNYFLDVSEFVNQVKQIIQQAGLYEKA